MPTTGALLAFIETLDHPEMVGVNPEVAHEHMSGLNFMHAIAQAWDAKKLFHIDLNDQAFGRYDQDLRFGSHSLKSCFFMVKFLEDVGYAGSRHFDSHAYRTEDVAGVKDFARGIDAVVPHLQGEGPPLERGQGDPGAREGDLDGPARGAAGAGRVQPGHRGRAEGPHASIARRWGRGD